MKLTKFKKLKIHLIGVIWEPWMQHVDLDFLHHFSMNTWLQTVPCMQSVLHLQGEPHQHRRADQRHAADPEHSRAQAAEHRRRSRRQQGREDWHRRRHQSTLDSMTENETQTGKKDCYRSGLLNLRALCLYVSLLVSGRRSCHFHTQHFIFAIKMRCVQMHLKATKKCTQYYFSYLKGAILKN